MTDPHTPSRVSPRAERRERAAAPGRPAPDETSWAVHPPVPPAADAHTEPPTNPVAYPSLLSRAVRAGLVDYLSTTFALTDAAARDALEAFLLDDASGIFRGPYVKVRTSFRTVGAHWASPLDWLPAGFRPYLHQAEAFARLSSRGRAPQPTIVTTGTGSGKTESFLYPLLDHARRERQRGRGGIKAVILYPMNALVTDQARRIAQLLAADVRLAGVTAGVYIGGHGNHQTMTAEHLIDDRSVIRQQPPDILLTNYKMLDLLLLRPDDQTLWSASRETMQYLVLDEFHTYDGAQGTDVAMLLRRFGAALGIAGPAGPLGRITPVATSATLGGGERPDALREFAATVFGCAFGESAIIGEHRLNADEILAAPDPQAVMPFVQEINRAPLPDADTPGSWRPLARAILGRDIRDRAGLAAALAAHPLIHAVIAAVAGPPRPVDDVLADLERDQRVTLAWGSDIRAAAAGRGDRRHGDQLDSAAAEALLRVIALVSAARTNGRPWLSVEVQIWARAVRRVIREVAADPRFRWWTDGPAGDAAPFLPSVYCRNCGQSGWQALATELGDYLDGTPEKIWRAAVTDRGRLRTVIPVGADSPGAVLLDPDGLAIHASAPGGVPEPGGADAELLSVVLTPDADAALGERCPACGSDRAIRFIGSSVATEMSVALTGLFGSDLLPAPEKKTLVFTDSVQDAAHRAAFIEGRAFAFNFRSALLRAVRGGPLSLIDAAAALAALPDEDIYAIVPPDFVRRLGLDGTFLDGMPRSGRQLLARRLAFQVQLEAGLRSRLGRTLELTGAATVDMDIDLVAAAELATETHANLPDAGLATADARAYRIWLLGVLDRLRSRGGIHHPWLDQYLADSGRRWRVWDGAARGMPKFPAGRPAPMAFTTAIGTDFDTLGGRGTWLSDWTARCLAVGDGEARALLLAVVPQLAEGSAAVLIRREGRSGAGVFVLDPARLVLQATSDDNATDGRVQMRCDSCHHVQPTPSNRADWIGAPCPRMRCGGHLRPAPISQSNYYRRLYTSGRIRRIVTHEHTGLLEREDRENVESAFKAGGPPDGDTTAPNVLTCTPTLELGIDIGDLSTVALASLPRSTASYLQRVGRAGRSTGNALVVATVPAHHRDLYYFEEPTALIAGAVTPPATYLRATELLQRQYLAYCLDLVARGSITLGGAMPPRLGPLIGPNLAEGSWLKRFCDHIAGHAGELADGFLALYGTELDDGTSSELRAFASGRAAAAIGAAVHDWHTQRGRIRGRLDELRRALADLDKQGQLDDEQQLQQRQWRGEQKAMLELQESMNNRETFTGLVGLSLLPNYNLQDDATTLDVSLWWTSDDEDGERTIQTSEYSIQRGSRTALTEFAPGATFYAYGQQIVIDAVDPGPAGSPAWREQRLCPSCGWGGDADPVPACPRCGDTAAADTGAVHRLLPFVLASASHHRDDTVIDEDADDRVRNPFAIVTGVDIAPADISRAWRLADKTFGAEFARRATVRSVNFGPLAGGGQEAAVAGERIPAVLFRTCSDCGVVHLPGVDEARVRHRGWCATRKGHVATWQQLALSHELHTQAVRILLPVSTFQVERRLVAFTGALLLGLRRDFGGDPQHLAVVPSAMPDQEGRQRRFLVLHDVVPGGTGYLDRLGDPGRLRHILTLARETLAACPCAGDGRAACHRCLLAVVPDRDVPQADRHLAVELLDDLLGDWTVQELDSVTAVDIGKLQSNEFEQSFAEALGTWVRAQLGGSVTALAGPGGTEHQLSFTGESGPRTWLLRPQVPVKAVGVMVQPDFVLTRQDSVSPAVAVFLDGKQFHASPEHNRTADDAAKRAALRDAGYRVFSLTYTDVTDWLARLSGGKPSLEPLVPAHLGAQVQEHVADPRVDKLWAPPVDLLAALLQHPDADVWREGAGQLAAAVVVDRSAGSSERVSAETLMAHLLAWARDGLAGEPSGPSFGTAVPNTDVIFPSATPVGLPLVVALDPDDGRIGALTVLDDSAEVVGGDVHDVRWRDWLRWMNVLQFLGTANSPTAGFGECWTTESLATLASRALTLQGSTIDVAFTSEWQQVVEFTDASVHPLIRALAEDGYAVPVPGEEVGDVGDVWQVELAWPESGIAVVIDDVAERDAWLAGHGWTVVRLGDVAGNMHDIEAAFGQKGGRR